MDLDIREMLAKKMPFIIENVELENGNLVFPKEARHYISELSKAAESTKMYEYSKEISDALYKQTNGDIRLLYTHMLEKIVGAPTHIHRDSSALLMMPLLYRALEAADAAKLQETEAQAAKILEEDMHHG